MAKIQQSKNYDKFILNEFNRDVKDTSALEKSMQKHGWIDAYPMHVTDGGGFYIIIGGHNRFEAAKKIGIPAKFVVCEDSATIPELEDPTKQWSMTDYLTSHARTGNQNYIHVQEYMWKTGFPISLCVAVCAGRAATAFNMHLTKRFKIGTYKIGNQDHADMLYSISLELSKIGVDFFRNSIFIKAVSKCVFVPEFDVKIFLKKSKKHKHLFEKKPTIDGYVDLIDQIYNRGSRNQIPLSFLANKYSKERAAIKK